MEFKKLMLGGSEDVLDIPRALAMIPPTFKCDDSDDGAWPTEMDETRRLWENETPEVSCLEDVCVWVRAIV